jgi:hypothetical protein
VIVATGDLDHLPQEIQTVSNVLNAAGWKVQLCLGPDASRAGLLAAAGEGDVDLAWFGLHSAADGFVLSDGTWPPAQLGTWLRNVNACDCVLNSCFSIEHVDAIQRAADNVGVACTINPAGVDDALAWQVGVHLARAYAVTEDLRSSVQWASGAGSLAYRFIPAAADAAAGGIRGGRMAMDESAGIREVVDNKIYGDIIHVAVDKVRAGSTLSDAFPRIPEIPGVVIQMMRVGEESGELDSILKTLAKFYDREVANAVDTLVDLIEPVMIVMLGLGVGTLLASVLIPIYNITNNIQ